MNLKQIVSKIPYIKDIYHFLYYNIFKKCDRVTVYPFNEFIKIDNPEIIKLIDASEAECYSPSTTDKEPNPVLRTMSPVYALCISDGTVIGGSNVVLKGKIALYNHNTGTSVNYSDGAFHDYRENYQLGKNRIYRSECPTATIDSGISMCINYNYNYYHYILECLSKFQLLDNLNLDAYIPLIIDKTAKDIPQFQQLLCIFNKTNREVIYLDRIQHLKVKKLYVFSPIQYLPANNIDISTIDCTDTAFRKESIIYLRNKILQEIDQIESSHNSPSKIFISRQNFKGRSYNNGEVKKELESLGFTTILPERLSLDEQARIFNNAEIIVAASGAALTNILFCKPETIIFVLANRYLDLSIFSTIARYLDLNMKYIIADSVDSADFHSSFHINVEKLKEEIPYKIAD